MPDEKANKPVHWKNKLDELESIPGEPALDRAMAWQTLYGRLLQKPLHRTTTRYWMVAACILCIMALSALVLVQPDATLINSDVQPKQIPLPKSLPQPAGRDVVIIPPQPAVKEKSIPSHTSERKMHPVLVRAVESRLVLSPDPIKNTLPAITIPPPDDTVHLIAAIPSRKKLRVVHINELNGTVDDGNLASSARSVPQKKMLHDDEAGLSLGRNASDNILKIKISSN